MPAFKDRTGETRIMKCGQKATIINYCNCKSIDIQFEDGTIVYNKLYSEFKRNAIGHPNINTRTAKFTKNHINEIRMMNCGQKATIINCNNSSNIDIQFEDGTIVYNKTYGEFKRNNIGHPNINLQTIEFIKNRTGETHMMRCGLKALIICYHGNKNIDVQFENGIIVYNRTYSNFKKGYIGISETINTIELKEFAYKLNNDWYYICSHSTWTEDKILSVKEIYAYQPELFTIA